MKVLVIYLLQVIAVSGLLYGYYHWVLRNNRFHQYNRFYLLSATVISIIIPFLDIPYYFTPAEKKSSFVLQTITAISPEQYSPVPPGNSTPADTSGQVSLSTVLFIFYLVITLIVFLRVILSLLYIRRLIHRNAKEQLGHIQFVNTSEPGTPFSFFRWLFWNRDIELQSDKGQQVFRHEVFHIEQKHSYDLLFMELLTVAGWFNPFFHLIKKELKAIHEFLADRFAINENTKWEYAEMLLMQALHTKQSLVNPFFQTHIKRRIAMITHSKKPGHQYARKLLVIPVAVIAVALFAFSYHEKNSIQKNPDDLVNTSSGIDTAIHPKQAGIWRW
jgi:beta-lactamase regulating signal transducer with metallopeptidase domain